MERAKKVLSHLLSQSCVCVENGDGDLGIRVLEWKWEWGIGWVGLSARTPGPPACLDRFQPHSVS